MAASGVRTGKIVRNLIQMHIPVRYPEKDLGGAEYPCVKTANAGRLKQLALIQITQAHIRKPAHQKSSALGMRVKAILPPANPPGGGVHSPKVTTRFPNLLLRRSMVWVIVSHL